MAVQNLVVDDHIAVGTPSGPAAAEDGDRPKWWEGGLWDIYIDRNFGNACYAVRSFLGGIATLMSVRPDGGLDFVIGRDSWQFAEPGKTFLLKFVFGNGATYEEELEAVAAGPEVVLSSRMSAAFLSDFMEKTSLLVYYQGSLIAPMLLLDTYEAVTQLRTCDASAPGMIDPRDPSLL